MMLSTVDKYIGIPYKKNGRDLNGCDCYGIVCMFYMDHFGIKLNQYVYDEIDAVTKNYTDEIELNWREVSEPVVGDVVYFNMLGHPMHVGVYIGGGKFIHNFSESGSSTIADINHNKWKQRLIGFWRYGKYNLQ